MTGMAPLTGILVGMVIAAFDFLVLAITLRGHPQLQAVA